MNLFSLLEQQTDLLVFFLPRYTQAVHNYRVTVYIEHKARSIEAVKRIDPVGHHGVLVCTGQQMADGI